MASILEILRQRKAGQQTVAPVSNTAQIQQVMAAGSGKATGLAGPRTSNIAEQAAQQAGATQVAQIDQASALAGTEALQKEGAITDATNLERRGLVQQENQALQKVGQNQSELDAYQSVFDEGMKSDKLRQKLRFKGEQERWDKQANFEQSLQRDIFGQARADLFTELGHKNIMAANERDFDIMMSKISIEDVLAMAERDRKDQATKDKYTSIGTMGAKGVGYAAEKGYFDSAPAQTPTSNAAVGGTGKATMTNKGIE